jgi:hypothetical protein
MDTNDTARWTTKEEEAFLDFLVEHKAKCADNGTFKKTTFHQAALHIAHLLWRSLVKIQDLCTSKYNSVSLSIFPEFMLHVDPLQMDCRKCVFCPLRELHS